MNEILFALQFRKTVRAKRDVYSLNIIHNIYIYTYINITHNVYIILHTYNIFYVYTLKRGVIAST